MTVKLRAMAMASRRWALSLLLLVVVVSCGKDQDLSVATREVQPPSRFEVPTRSAPSRGEASQIPPELRAAQIEAVQRDAPPNYRLSAEGSERVGGYNEAQRLTLGFERGGLQITDSAGAFALSLSTTGFGCEGAMEAVADAELNVDGNRAVYRRDALVEWYVNGPLGLEQGFTLPAPPPCRTTSQGGGAPVLELALGGELVGELASGTAASGAASPRMNELILRDSSGRAVLRYTDLFVRDAEGRSMPAWLSLAGDRLAIHIDDAGATYPLEVDPLIWAEQTKLRPSESDGEDYFGESVAVSGDTAVVGAHYADSQGKFSGSAYVFVRSGGLWTQQQRLLPDDGEAYATFGNTVAIEGDTVVVGAESDNDNGDYSGSAYVFVRSGAVWTQEQKLLPGDGTQGDRFGFSVGISGDTVVVGAAQDDDLGFFVGSAYIFVRSGGVWSQEQKLFPSDPGPSDGFGNAVAIAGETVVVAADSDDNNGSEGADVGSVYVFVRSNKVWSEEQKLVGDDAAIQDRFGTSVAIAEDTVAVGASDADASGSNSGSAYVFVRSGGVWSQEQKLLPSDGSADDYFGNSIAVSGDTVVVGAPVTDDQGQASGAAYVFVRSGGVWSQEQKLLPGDGAADDYFGISVAVSGSTAVVGAYRDDNPAKDSGSAYVFALLDVGQACTSDASCSTGFCVDGVCCSAPCGGNNTTDCQACSVEAGAAVDGACAVVADNTPCAGGVCLAGACDDGSGTGGSGGGGGAGGSGGEGGSGMTGDPDGCGCRLTGISKGSMVPAWLFALSLIGAARMRQRAGRS